MADGKLRGIGRVAPGEGLQLFSLAEVWARWDHDNYSGIAKWARFYGFGQTVLSSSQGYGAAGEEMIEYAGNFDSPEDMVMGEHVVIRVIPANNSGVRYLECRVTGVIAYSGNDKSFDLYPLTIEHGMTVKQMFGRLIYGDALKDTWPFASMTLAPSIIKASFANNGDWYSWMRLARTASVMAAEYPDGLVCKRCNGRNPHAGAEHLKDDKYVCFNCR